MDVTVSTSEGKLTFQASELEVARLLASVTGMVLDLEPDCDGRWVASVLGDNRGALEIIRKVIG